jgi:3-oxoacyl-[acyl-carrier protein] reductase
VGRRYGRHRRSARRPDEAAGVVALLLSEQAATITGQVLDAEAGFRRSTA